MKLVHLNVLKKCPQDEEWAEDWHRITEVYETIDRLENLFSDFDVSYLRELQQKTLVLNLKKYAWSLQGLILEKYSDIKSDEGI
jgi:hypothetical protein